MTLSGKVFGTYDATPFGADSEEIKTIEFIQRNFTEVYPFGTRKNYEDFIFQDWKSDEISEDYDATLNSYNWNGSVVLQARFFEYRGKKYTAVAFHRFGDVRGNYTPYAILNCDKEEFLNTMCELDYKIPSESDWDIRCNFFNEAGVVSCWNCKTQEDYNGYYDSDDAPAEVRNACQKYY